ncbi:MAG: tetratricopeptide repeat protein [Muribaculaceae bacterium]
MIFRALHITGILIITIFASCSHSIDPRLVKLEIQAEKGEDSALVALDSLKAINAAELNRHNRHYYDFLTIKISDKAYIRHTSDSLILNTIKEAPKYGDQNHYAEALYYGGRVYSDLGDYPQSLRYFQDALDQLPQQDFNPDLKYRILSQTASIFEKLRLYKEAIPHLEEILKYSTTDPDTLGVVKDLHLLGAIYIHSSNYKKADSCFILSASKCKNLPAHYLAISNMYRAGIYEQTGKIDSAVILIDKVPFLVKPISRNTALAYAARIYLKAGMLDSAYINAKRLIQSDNSFNQENGYDILLSDKIRKKIHPDTLARYALDYRNRLEKIFNDNENQLALQQQSFYNYKLHDRDRAKAEESVSNLWLLILIISIVLLSFIIISLIYRNKNQKSLILLHEALEKVNSYSTRPDEITGENSKSQDDTIIQSSNHFSSLKDKKDALRERLRQEYIRVTEVSEYKIKVDPSILTSEPYIQLSDYISKERELKENSPIWKKLEDVIFAACPNLRTNLSILVDGQLSVSDLHTLLLIKCGMNPSQMAILLNRTKGTIVSRRDALSIKILGEKVGTKVIDEIIRFL